MKFNTCDANNYTVSYGDGTSALLDSIAPIPHSTTNCYEVPLSWSHTYSPSGSYVAQLLVGSQSVSRVPITVTGDIVLLGPSVPGSSQNLANALTALEAALRAILEKLK